MAGRRVAREADRPARAATVVVPLPRAGRERPARRAPDPPLGALAPARVRDRRSRGRRLCRRTRHVRLRRPHHRRRRARLRPSPFRCAARFAATSARACFEIDLDACAQEVDALPTVASALVRPLLSAHASCRRRAGAPGRRRAPGRRLVARLGARTRDGEARRTAPGRACRASGSARASLSLGGDGAGDPRRAARSGVAARRLALPGPGRVRSTLPSDELTLILRSGLEVRLGDATDVPLKLAVAAKVLPLVAADTRYVDVSVPERPVAGSVFHAAGAAAASADTTAPAVQPSTSVTDAGTTSTLKSQVEVDGAGSTTP